MFSFFKKEQDAQLQNLIGDLNTAKKDLGEKIETNTGKIETNTGKIKTNEANIKQHEIANSASRAQVVNLGKVTTATNSDVTALTKTVNDLDKAIQNIELRTVSEFMC